MKVGFYRVVMLGLVAIVMVSAGGNRADAMKALSSADLGGLTGTQGITIYFQDIDANVMQLDYVQLDFSPSDATDCTFVVTDDSNATTMPLGNDAGGHAMSFCGSPTDENVPIDVDFLGFKIDIGRGDTAVENDYLSDNAVTMSLIGYGSTEMYYVLDLAQFVKPSGVAYDVFGLTLGEIFWAEKYMDPDKHQFMHLLLSPLTFYDDLAFFDSNLGTWQPAITLRSQIRSRVGVGGELGLKPGGGTFGFIGFKKADGTPQKATANSVMLAGKILDRGTAANPYPNWKTHRAGVSYYGDDLNQWNIMGEAVLGVHHRRTITRTGYIGSYYGGASMGDISVQVRRWIGQTSQTRPLRFEVATAAAGTDCDGDGLRDTYLVTYINGHYSRSVYYPDCRVSSMGDSPWGSPVPTVNSTGGHGFMKNYIVGDLRIGLLEEKTADMDGNGAVDSVTNAGSMIVNDISLEYGKTILPGDRNLVQEISAASEPYLIPNRDYGSNGSVGMAQLVFADPTSSQRTMEIAVPTNGAAPGGYPPINFNPPDLARPGTWWR